MIPGRAIKVRVGSKSTHTHSNTHTRTDRQTLTLFWPIRVTVLPSSCRRPSLPLLSVYISGLQLLATRDLSTVALAASLFTHQQVLAETVSMIGCCQQPSVLLPSCSPITAPSHIQLLFILLPWRLQLSASPMHSGKPIPRTIYSHQTPLSLLYHRPLVWLLFKAHLNKCSPECVRMNVFFLVS